MDQNSKMDQKSKTAVEKFNNSKSRSPKPKTHWRKTYQMDLESKLNEWWVRGAANLKRKVALIEKTQN